MITKYTRVEKILEVKSSAERLNYNDGGNGQLRFAKFAAMSDGVRREDDYLYVRCRAISSRVNKNNDGWPSEELSRSYKTFENRPIFVDHNNDNPKRTRGVIVAADLHVDKGKESALDPYYASAPDNHKPPTWIELLLEVDAKTYPKLAEKIEKGHLDAVSMGANIETSICSVCAHEAATPSEYCSHVKQKGITFEVTSDTGEKIRKKAYEDCYGINFFEISFVFDPADPTADAGHSFKGASLQKKAAEAGVDFNEIRQYLEARGEKVEMLSDMVGKTLPMQHVAALKSASPDVEQFMTPAGQGDASKNRNHIPQEDMTTAPEHVDTLRNDSRCPVCHAAEMEAGADDVLSCPVCGHVQEPAPLNNPDLEVARDNQLRQDNSNPDQNVLPVDQADPLDAVQFDVQQPGQPTSKKKYTNEGISEMFTLKLRTESKEEADKVLPAKVARIETKLGHGIHRGIYDAAREAGLKVKVAYPAIKDAENSVEVPGDNGIFNLFFAEESAINLRIPMEDVPVVVEASTQEEAEAFIKIMSETQLPSRKRAENDKRPLLPGSKPSDEPKKEKVVENPSEPVESKVAESLTLETIVELDGKKYKLEEIEDEEETEPEAVVEEDEPEDDADAKDDKKDEAESKTIAEPVSAAEEDKEDDRESRLLAAFKLADLSVEMGLVAAENKMAFIAELEEESLEQLNAREATLNSVKTAGLSKRSDRSPLQGVRRVPRLSHAVPSMNGNTPTNDDTPIEALFL